MTIADRVHDITLQIAAAASLADAQALLLWSQAMIGNIERGDLDIGIVSVELARMVPTALEKALALGLAQAGITLADWLVRSPLEEPDFEAADMRTQRFGEREGFACRRHIERCKKRRTILIGLRLIHRASILTRTL